MSSISKDKTFILQQSNMEFRTIIDIPKFGFGISHNNKCLFIGSCFAENIGNKLAATKIHTSVNPTGILYNPLSICKSIKNALSDRRYGDEDVFLSGGAWNSFDFHSRFSNVDKNVCIENINSALQMLKQEIETADIMFVTFGTAYVYELAGTGKIVCNCHKQPEKHFNRRLLNVSEIVECRVRNKAVAGSERNDDPDLHHEVEQLHDSSHKRGKKQHQDCSYDNES